jgi:putative NADH-flavin reductase
LQRLSLLSVELEEVAKGQSPEILVITGFTSMAVDAVAGLLASEREKEYSDCCREYANELLEFSSHECRHTFHSRPRRRHEGHRGQGPQ